MKAESVKLKLLTMDSKGLKIQMWKEWKMKNAIRSWLHEEILNDSSSTKELT